MAFLLDTNACIHFLRHRDSAVGGKLATVNYQDVSLCSVVKAELYYGVQRGSRPDQDMVTLKQFFANFISLPFDDRAAEEYGRIRAQLARQGALIGPNDLMIAAIALVNNATLVTHNTREFKRVSGLQVVDWEEAP